MKHEARIVETSQKKILNREHRIELMNLRSFYESVKSQYQRAAIVLRGENSTVRSTCLQGEANDFIFFKPSFESRRTGCFVTGLRFTMKKFSTSGS